MAVQARRAKPPRKSTSISNVRYCNLPPRPAPVLPPGSTWPGARDYRGPQHVGKRHGAALLLLRSRHRRLGRSAFSDGTTQRLLGRAGGPAGRGAQRVRGVEGPRHRTGVPRGRRPRRSGGPDRIPAGTARGPTLARRAGSADERAHHELRLGSHHEYGRTTALHEIGHTLGMPHEHQNPFTGIVWDEPAVYAYFGGAAQQLGPRQHLPQRASQVSTPARWRGFDWDPDSIMEYWFPGA